MTNDRADPLNAGIDFTGGILMGRSIRPNVRWKVFARDDFTCRYCGRSPPDVVLNCDHVSAVANGGSDDEANLVTACDECNAGKAAKVLVPKPDDGDKRAIADETAKHFPRVADALMAAMAAEGERLEAEGVKTEASGLCLALAGIRLAADIFRLIPLPKRIGKKRFLALCAAQFDEIDR